MSKIIIASGQLLGSYFTVLSEECQNRAILPIIAFYAKNKPIEMKKACELCELFFPDVPHTQTSTRPGEGSRGGRLL